MSNLQLSMVDEWKDANGKWKIWSTLSREGHIIELKVEN